MKNEKVLENILAISTGFVVIGLVIRVPTLIVIAVGVNVMGLFFPVVARCLVTAWLWMSHKMGAVVSRVILSVMYYGMLLPLALLSGRQSRRTLQLSRNPSGSYFVTRDHLYQSDDLKTLW
jgi:hypothetical protein